MSRRQTSAERLLIAGQAAQCVNWLKYQGFDVLCVEGGPRITITIRNSPLCDQLDGVVEGFSRSLKGEQRYRYVTRFGCTVVWDATPATQPFMSGIKRVMHWIGGAA